MIYIGFDSSHFNFPVVRYMRSYTVSSKDVLSMICGQEGDVIFCCNPAQESTIKAAIGHLGISKKILKEIPKVSPPVEFGEGDSVIIVEIETRDWDPDQGWLPGIKIEKSRFTFWVWEAPITYNLDLISIL